MTKKEFLDDMVAFYSVDPIDRRAVNYDVCKYKTTDGKKCAIGRWILDENYDKDFEGNGIQSWKTYESTGKTILQSLPEEIQLLGDEFLRDVQNLHDNRTYWDDKGLSVAGKINYDAIDKRYCK